MHKEDSVGTKLKSFLNSRAGSVAVPAILLIVLVSFGAFSNAVFHDFIYDDFPEIVRNHVIRDLSRLPELYHRSAWIFDGAPATSNYYRPLRNTIFMLTYSLFGLRAWGFHLVNIIFHALNAILVYIVTAQLFEAPPSSVSSWTPRSPSLARFLSPPLMTALLFASHPVNTEAVSWVSGLPDLSFAFFCLLSISAYLFTDRFGTASYVVSLASFFLACLCKEPALTLPFILIAYECVFTTSRPGYKKTLTKLLPYFLLIGVYLNIRISVLGAFMPLESTVRVGFMDSVAAAFSLFARYLSKLIFPLDLNFWPSFSPMASVASFKMVMPFLVTCLFFVFLLLSFRKNRMVFLGLVFIIVPLSPALYVQGIVGKTMAERYLYLSTFGFALCATCGILYAAAFLRNTKVLSVFFVVVVSAFTILTFNRNTVWKNDYTLFLDAAAKSPESVVPRLELGNALLAMARYDEAITQYLIAIRLDPNLYITHYHLGLALAKKGALPAAVQQYATALQLNPRAADIYSDLALAYARAGFPDLAIDTFETAVRTDPGNAYLHNQLGVAYAQRRYYSKAVQEFDVASSLAPWAVNYTRNRDDALRLLNNAAVRGRTSPDSLQDIDFSGRYEEKNKTLSDLVNFAW